MNNNIETQKSVLGYIIANPHENLITLYKDLLIRDIFDDKYKVLFDYLIDKDNKGELYSDVSIIEKRPDLKGILRDCLTARINDITLYNIESYILLLHDQKLKNDIDNIKKSILLRDTADPFEFITILKEKISGIERSIPESGSMNFPDIYKNYAIKRIEQDEANFIEVELIKNLKLGEKDMIILAARPSMGKTSLSIFLAKELSKRVRVGYITLETSQDQVIEKIVSGDLNTRLNDVYLNQDTKDKLMNYNNASLYNLFINDKVGNIDQIEAVAARDKHEHNLKVLFIDYLQLIAGGKGTTKNETVGNISQRIKQLAKNLNITIVALSQLSRDVEKRGGDKRPILSDLRDSGSLEQDADTVIFLYRPHYYGIFTNSNGEAIEDLTEIIKRKDRNHGELGTDYVAANENYSKYNTHNDIEQADYKQTNEQPF